MTLAATLQLRRKLSRRAACSTCCSLAAPPIFALILVIGYALSSDLDVASQMYSEIVLDLSALREDLSPSFFNSLSTTTTTAPTARPSAQDAEDAEDAEGEDEVDVITSLEAVLDGVRNSAR